MNRKPEPRKPSSREEFISSLKRGALLGTAVLVVALPSMRAVSSHRPQAAPPALVQPAAAPAAAVTVAQAPVMRLASFGAETPTPPVREIANWTMHSRDHGQRAFVVIDKQDARVWVFNPDGDLVGNGPALLGAAIGDDSAPGIGDKPLNQVLPEEKTTPAGRFIAEPGVNANGEDIVWVSYDLAVSMHRVRPVVAAERRLERLASPTPADNRISFGCINLPPSFYENVLRSTVRKYGAVVYVLPETRSPAQVFNSYDVPSQTPVHTAQR